MSVCCDELVITTMHNYLPTIALLAVQWGYLNSYSAIKNASVIIKYYSEYADTCQSAFQDQ